MEPKAFSLASSGILRKLVTDVFYSVAFKPEQQINEIGIKKFSGLWDTGASASVISHEVANELGLIPITQQRVLHAQGEQLANVYKVNIFLPNQIMIPNVKVTEGRINLIGMDIISLGDFALSNRDGKTLFSFQIPSTHYYDFVKQINQQQPKKKTR